MFQTCDNDDEDVEIAVDNPAFMDEFFSQACLSVCFTVCVKLKICKLGKK